MDWVCFLGANCKLAGAETLYFLELVWSILLCSLGFSVTLPFIFLCRNLTDYNSPGGRASRCDPFTSSNEKGVLVVVLAAGFVQFPSGVTSFGYQLEGTVETFVYTLFT